MDVITPRCAGLDVHKRTVVACCIIRDEQGQKTVNKRTFGTMTGDLLELSDWLYSLSVTHIAMESTGEYWRPVYNILEGAYEQSNLLVVNAKHVKNVPGPKTDVNDAEWIADLLQHGLLRASFIPNPSQRDLRDLTRHRTNFVRERATLVNRVQKVLETANIKLASVASDVMGVSGRAMLKAIIEGKLDPASLSLLAKGRLRDKTEQLEKALTGKVSDTHRLILSELLSQIDNLDKSVSNLNKAIEEKLGPFDKNGELLGLIDTIPGVARTTTQVIVSEIGTDMSRFPSAGHLCAWAGVAPGNNESAGKRLSGKTRDGNKTLTSALVQAAHAAAHTNSYIAALYHRIAARRGKKRALIAVAHAILVMVYHIIKRHEPYMELGKDYFDRRKPEQTAKRLISRLQQLGYSVVLPEPVVA